MSGRQTQTARIRATQDEIDSNLRRAFDEAANEPLPDRFTDLLERLRAGQGGGSDPEGS